MCLLLKSPVLSLKNSPQLKRTLPTLYYKQLGSVLRLRYDLVRPYCSVKEPPPPPAEKKPSLADELLSAKVKATEEPGSTEDKDAKEEQERTRRAMKWTFVGFGVMVIWAGGIFMWTWGAPELDKNGMPIPDEFSDLNIVQQYLYRSWRECNNMNTMIKEPSREKLLPDTLKEPYIQPPYTLVLELRDVLVHPEWTYETGWRFKKRPGVDFLLQHCAPPLFEIVIYTYEQGFTAFPLIDNLDPNGNIWYRLFKDSTRYVDGIHQKDLNRLNRDLNKVIMIDWDDNAVTAKRNQLKLKRWDGDIGDQTLIDLGIMLRTIAESEVSDVREVLDYYRTFDDPLGAFKENQRAAAEQELILRQKAEEDRKRGAGIAGSWSSSFLRRR